MTGRYSQRRLAWALILILGLITVYFLSRSLWLFLAPAPTLATDVDSAAPQAVAPIQPPVADQLAQRQLFGHYQPPDPLGLGIEAPETQLALTLRGVVAAETPGQGFAIIADGRGREGVYGVDAELEPGTRVLAVYPDRVILSRNGNRESLSLAEHRQGGGDQRFIRVTAAPAASQTVEPAPPQALDMARVRQNLTLNLATLSSTYRLLPVAGGGYRLSLNRGATGLMDAGLQQGDVITAANGAQLDSPLAVQQVIAEVLAGKPLTLTVRRGDEVIAVKPDLNALTGSR